MSLRSDTIRLAYERPALRAALLPIIAKEFPTPEALRDYLADHPHADPKNHSVAKPGGGKGDGDAPKPKIERSKAQEPPSKPKATPKVERSEVKKDEKGEEKGEGEKGEAEGASTKLKGFLGKVKGISKEMAQAVTSAPAKVQKFVSDPESRKETISSIGKALQKSPRKVVGRIHEAAKKELKELKHATHAARKVLRKPPQKWTKEDRAAVYSAAVYVAGAAVAAAGGGPIAAAGILGKSFAMHVGIKAMHDVLDKGFLHFEAAETVLHALHFAAEDDDEKYEEALIASLTAAVARVLEKGISDEEMESILKGTEEPDMDSFGDPKVGKEASLRQNLIRLAYTNPELRPHLVTLLRTADMSARPELTWPALPTPNDYDDVGPSLRLSGWTRTLDGYQHDFRVLRTGLYGRYTLLPQEEQWIITARVMGGRGASRTVFIERNGTEATRQEAADRFPDPSAAVRAAVRHFGRLPGVEMRVAAVTP